VALPEGWLSDPNEEITLAASAEVNVSGG